MITFIEFDTQGSYPFEQGKINCSEELEKKIKEKKQKTRGQRPNESQKAVIIDMIKSVGEIASKMWPVV